MSEKQKKPLQWKKTLPRLLLLLPLMLFGGMIGYFGATTIDSMTGGNDVLFFVYLGVMVLELILAFAVQIVLHEAGHLLFGLMSGYRFLSFNVFGFVWQKGPDGRLHAGRLRLPGAGGQCLMLPPAYNGGKYAFHRYNLGGVLMNLLSSLLCALLAWGIPFAPLRLLLVAQAAVGLYFAVVNGVPFSTPALQNDGKNILCIRRDENARRAFWVQLSMAAALAQGKRYRELPEDWFTPFPEEALDNPITSAIAVHNVSRLMDRLDFPAALAALRPLLARKKGVLGIYRLSLLCDGAVCELIEGQHPSPLAASLSEPANQQMIAAMKAHPGVLRTQYALALLEERDGEKAQKILARFDQAAQHHPNAAEVAGERELLLAIQNALLTGGNPPC